MNELSVFSLSLLLLCLALLSQTSQGASKRILLQNNFPLANCTIGTVGKSPPAFFGIEVDYMKDLATELGWSDSFWDFECVDSKDLTTLLNSDTTLYIGALGGQRIQYEQMIGGYTYSRPTLFSGLSTLIHESYDQWFFITIISLNVGLAILGTAIGVALFQYVFEGRCVGLEQYLWNAFASIFFVSTVRLSTTPARLLQIAYWFMVLIITATYQANMTALLAVQGVMDGIQSTADLNTKNLMAPAEFEFNLYSYGIKPTIDENSYDPEYIYDQLVNGDFDGVTVPDPLASWIAQTYCEVYMVTRFYYKYNYGMLFASTQDSTLIDEINVGIAKVNNATGSIARVKNFLAGYDTCVESSQPFQDRIIFMSLQGIWILMAVTLGVAIIIHFIITRSCTKRMLDFLTECTILNPLEEIDNYLVGDALIVQNLKDVSQLRMRNLEKIVKERLYTMDTHIDKFRKLLEKKVTGRELQTIVNLNLHQNAKNLKKVKSTKLSDEAEVEVEKEEESISFSVGREKNDENEVIELQNIAIANDPSDFKVRTIKKNEDESEQ